MNINNINELRAQASILSNQEITISHNINELRAIHTNCFIYEYMADMEDKMSCKINELRALLKATRFNLYVCRQRIEFYQSNQEVTRHC